MLRRLSGLILSGRNASSSVSSTKNPNGNDGSSAPKEINVGDNEGKNESEKMQRKTFRRWVNKYLKPRDMQVNHIINDWENGILLINLLEVLSRSEKPFAKYNKTPKLKLHSLENLNASISFMKANQIPLVNIGSEDIYQHNPTIVMGLLWSLILKYGLAAGKVEVMNWCNKRLEPFGLEVKNFTDDWKNGYLFAAIIASQFPEQLDFSSCSKDDAISNMEKAFTVADHYLEVNRLLDPQDVLSNPDEKSIVAYVGEIYSAIEDPRPPRPVPKPSEPTVSKISTSSLTLSWKSVPGAINMKIQCLNDSGDWADITTQPYTETSYKVDELLPDKNYQFRMVALSARSQSPPGEPLSCRTLAQGAPVISDLSVRGCTVSWDPHPKATGYQLQVLKKSDGSWDKAKIIPSGQATTIGVSDLNSSTEYECRVVALIGDIPSEPSIPCSLETLVEPPPKPVLSNATDNSFRADWKPCENATRYYVQVKGGENESWDTDPKTIPVEGKTFCEINHLVPGEVYHVRVIADVEGKGISEPSEEEAITTTMSQDRCALVTGADIGSGCGIIMRLLEQSNSTNTSWEQGFSTVYVVTDNPSGALRNIAEKNPTKVKIILVRDFSDPEAIKDAAKELSKMTNCINLCINYANLGSNIISGLLAGIGQ